MVREGDIKIFESGAMLIYIGEKDERILPSAPVDGMRAFSWLFAALNTIEPVFFELSNVSIFSADQEWAKLRRPGLLESIGARLDGLVGALSDQSCLTGSFSIADIAMSTMLREARDTDLVFSRPTLAAYVQRCIERPAFERAMAAQLRPFARGPGNPSWAS